MAANAVTDSFTSMLRNQITQLNILLQNETEIHQITYSLLSQSRACSQIWEQVYSTLLAELDFVYIQLAGTDVKVRQLTEENRRLNLTLNHLVPARAMPTPEPEWDDRADVQHYNAEDDSEADLPQA